MGAQIKKHISIGGHTRALKFGWAPKSSYPHPFGGSGQASKSLLPFVSFASMLSRFSPMHTVASLSPFLRLPVAAPEADAEAQGLRIYPIPLPPVYTTSMACADLPPTCEHPSLWHTRQRKACVASLAASPLPLPPADVAHTAYTDFPHPASFFGSLSLLRRCRSEIPRSSGGAAVCSLSPLAAWLRACSL